MSTNSGKQSKDKYIIGFDVGGGSIRASLYKQSNGELHKLPLQEQGTPASLENADFTGIIVKDNVAKKRFQKGKANIIANITEVARHVAAQSPEPVEAIGLALPCRFESSGTPPRHAFEDGAYTIQQRNSGMDMATPPSECWGTDWAKEIGQSTHIKTIPLNDANMALLAHWQAAQDTGTIAPAAAGWGLYAGAGTGFGAAAAQFGGAPKILHNSHMYDGLLPLDAQDKTALMHICEKSGIRVVHHNRQDITPNTIFVEKFPKLIDGKPVLHLINDGGKEHVLTFQLFAASSIQTLTGGNDLKTLTPANDFGGHGKTLELVGKYLGRYTKAMQAGSIARIPSEGVAPIPKLSGEVPTIKWVFLGGGAFTGELGARIKQAASAECPSTEFLRTTDKHLDVCAAAARTACAQLELGIRI